MATPKPTEQKDHVATNIEVPMPDLEMPPMRAAQSALRRLCHAEHPPWLQSQQFELCGDVLRPFDLSSFASEYIIKVQK